MFAGTNVSLMLLHKEKKAPFSKNRDGVKCGNARLGAGIHRDGCFRTTGPRTVCSLCGYHDKHANEPPLTRFDYIEMCQSYRILKRFHTMERRRGRQQPDYFGRVESVLTHFLHDHFTQMQYDYMEMRYRVLLTVAQIRDFRPGVSASTSEIGKT